MSVPAQSWFAIPGTATVVFGFLKTEGTPLAVQRELKEVVRPGVDDLGHFLKGLRGQKFAFKTWTDAASLAAGKTLQGDCLALRNAQVDLYWQQTFTAKCYIYEVQPELVEVGLLAVGGFGNGVAMVPVTWTMRCLTS